MSQQQRKKNSFSDAIVRNNRQEVHKVLQAGMPVDTHLRFPPFHVPILPSEGTPLVLAAVHGHQDLVKLFLENGAHADYRDPRNERTLLMLIVMIPPNDNTIDIIHLLLDRDAALINAVDIRGNTALMFACSRGNTDIVRLLLERDALLNVQNADGYTALMHACSRGNTDIVRLLLEHDADPNIRNKKHFERNCALNIAIMKNHRDIIRLLLKYNADVNFVLDPHSRIAPPLLVAVRMEGEQNLDIIQLLLDYGADPNYKNELLWVAARSHRLNVLSLLLHRKGIDVNPFSGEMNRDLLPLVIREGFYDIAQLLLRRPVIRQNLRNVELGLGMTALNAAVYVNNVAIAKILLEAGVDPNTSHSLLIASQRGHEEMVKLLLEHHADPNLTDDKGKTPLSGAKTPQIRQLLQTYPQQLKYMRMLELRILGGQLVPPRHPLSKKQQKLRNVVKAMSSMSRDSFMELAGFVGGEPLTRKALKAQKSFQQRRPPQTGQIKTQDMEIQQAQTSQQQQHTRKKPRIAPHQQHQKHHQQQQPNPNVKDRGVRQQKNTPPPTNPW